MIEETKKKITENLVPLFEKAGVMCLELRNQGLKKEIKKDNTPVTNGDIEVNNLITSEIAKITPEIPIVSEETSANKSNENLKNFWLIDPIDGTNDYINDKDEFTINAGLIINNRPEAGIIYAPAKKRLFYSYDQGKCFEISDNKEKIKRIHTTFFETTTAMAFDYFSRKRIDFGVIETGLGGRLDSTNVINPEICCITSISLDHTDILGKTIKK